jgi:hypothetical protein
MDKTDLRVTFIEQFSIFDFESKDLTNGNNFHAMLVMKNINTFVEEIYYD